MILKTMTHNSTPQFRVPFIDSVGVSERVAKFQSRSVKGESKWKALKLVLSMIDLTTLEGKDTDNKVRQMCYKAKNLAFDLGDIPHVAAVCVFPTMVGVAKQELINTTIKVASVSTAFPSGQSSLEVKLSDTKNALDNGADEIDMVISRGKFLSGDYDYVFHEIKEIKALCGDKTLKVILETGELGSLDNVRLASEIALLAGADFIKTSTGKISPAATMEVTYVMLTAIKDYYDRTGIRVGMKPAGGISTSKLAIQYLVMVKEVLGEDWLCPSLFRFGASSLANDVLLQMAKYKNGNYQSKDYISID
jgi:deoxyribose-phosphate aldolase